MIMLGPEAQSALIGVAAVGVTYLGKIGVCFVKNKVSKNGKAYSANVCKHHDDLVSLVNKINDHFQDERQVDLYSRAIRKVKDESKN